MPSSQKGYALIIILMLTIVLFFTGSAALNLGGSVRKTAALETEQKKAYYIAEAGIERAVDKAKRESAWVQSLALNSEVNLVPGVIPAGYADGNFVHIKVRKEFHNESKTVLSIQSKGQYRDVYREIKVKVDLGRPMPFYRGYWTESPPGAPSAFLNNTVIGSDITVNGNIVFMNNCNATGDIRAGGNVTVESNMTINPKNLYAGGTVEVRNNGEVAGNIQAVGDVTLGNNAKVGGEVKSMGNIALSNNTTVGGDIRANGEITGPVGPEGVYPRQSLDLHFVIPPFPEINLAWYRKNADYYYSGSQTWSGSFDLDGLSFIDGDLIIRGTYSGTGTVVVGGQTTFNGSLDCKDTGKDNLCILCAGNVTLINGVQVRTLVYSPATVTMENNSIMRGSVIARTLIQKQNSKFYYEPAMEARQSGWITTSLEILSWEEK
ncbi:MAG: Polymer-forming cytoskeletal [Firmicutes bacterium ADurb.Bin456]|nr:MAG: Polymer-forming cytoskeletal [Firmicutes bacterium ADurb.Bin456]